MLILIYTAIRYTQQSDAGCLHEAARILGCGVYNLFTRLAVSPGRSVPDGVSALCRGKSRPVERFVYMRI